MALGAQSPDTHVTLIVDVNAAIASAMKARDQAKLVPLRMLKTALTNRGVEKGRELDETESLQIVSSLIKQRRDSIEQFEKGGRSDLAAKEAAEIRILEAYLPPAPSPEEVEHAVDTAITATQASSMKDLGRVMKAVMATLAGRSVDGKIVNELARRKLGG